MRAANSGDGSAYERLLREMTPALRALARRVITQAGVAVDAEDIVQETLIAVHLKRQTWVASEPIGPWVRAIARHKAIDAMRRRGRHVHVPVEDFEDLLPTEETTTDYPRRDLERHLHSLPRARQFSKGITNRDKECHISGAQEAEALTPAQSPREVPFGMSTYELSQTVEGPTFGGDGHVV